MKWFNDRKGYGFISQEDGNDVFVHYSSIEAQGFKTLAEGDQVDFEIQETDRGPEAKSVKKSFPAWRLTLPASPSRRKHTFLKGRSFRFSLVLNTGFFYKIRIDYPGRGTSLSGEVPFCFAQCYSTIKTIFCSGSPVVRANFNHPLAGRFAARSALNCKSANYPI